MRGDQIFIAQRFILENHLSLECVSLELQYSIILTAEGYGVQTWKKVTGVLTENGQKELTKSHLFEEGRAANRVVNSKTNKWPNQFLNLTRAGYLHRIPPIRIEKSDSLVIVILLDEFYFHSAHKCINSPESPRSIQLACSQSPQWQ